MPQEPKPIPIKITKVRARDIIREIAKDSSLVFISHHARQSMVDDRITQTDVLRVLRAGFLVREPMEDLAYGNWECLVQGISAGENIAVSVAIENAEPGLNIITVYKVR